MARLYNKFSEHMKNKYGEKVYKLPVNILVTCPNRDGTISREGCAFCGEEGAGFENLPASMTVKEQLEKNMQYIGEKYHASKFIAYFQNYTNTYLPPEKLEVFLQSACIKGVVSLYISTRPDCVSDAHLAVLKRIQKNQDVEIVLELGLQTVNYKTLTLLKRGHTLAQFIDAAVRIRTAGLACCVHYITDLPMDTMEDVIEGAKILSALQVAQVKCHSMYILKDTMLGTWYEEGSIQPVSVEEYIDRTITFLEYLHPDIVVQRLIGRAPKERTLFCNWGMSWWRIHEQILNKMQAEERYQGKCYKNLSIV